MARITVEDCVDKFASRFELVLIASHRAKKLHSGELPTVEKENDKNTVIALREIAETTIPINEMKENLISQYQTYTILDEEEDVIVPIKPFVVEEPTNRHVLGFDDKFFERQMKVLRVDYEIFMINFKIFEKFVIKGGFFCQFFRWGPIIISARLSDGVNVMRVNLIPLMRAFFPFICFVFMIICFFRRVG